jgi:hypothetical protein
MPGGFGRALGGVVAVAASIADGPLASALFGWTSMFDLCIQQTDTGPDTTTAYLRVSPLDSGLVEFRYVDTRMSERQWHREVQPEAAVARFDAFLRQLRWVAVPPDPPSTLDGVADSSCS